ncbi:MAG: molybdate ABC transporter substrate-binding protein [Wolinella succinogenes]|uniref:molybdate ABC transporter substrate-binding protein n=1 Tax=Wolinella succinogenes TaxID=844 RepID=UPI0016AF8D30|nr:molybdate ABC transporter substrate-binding protein [Wolinella succinogenes]NLU35297.1 molybdate ABC transporter substrate-binding protein [Wolinella succinogenes]
MKKLGILLGILALSVQLYAEKINVFVAASARHAVTEIKDEFLKNRKNDEIELNFGASGKAYQQLKNGFPYDMFFSADAKYAAQIEQDGNAGSAPAIYAMGVVALYALDEKLLEGGVESLANEKFKHISIASPKVAPYGVAAVEILQSYGIFEKVEKRIVMGDNISQAVHFVDSGAAEIGLVAYSLLRQGDGAKGKYITIDPSKYSPMAQSFVITKKAKDSDLAKAFAEYVVSDRARAIFEKYGFNAPAKK